MHTPVWAGYYSHLILNCPSPPASMPAAPSAPASSNPILSLLASLLLLLCLLLIISYFYSYFYDNIQNGFARRITMACSREVKVIII